MPKSKPKRMPVEKLHQRPTGGAIARKLMADVAKGCKGKRK